MALAKMKIDAQIEMYILLSGRDSIMIPVQNVGNVRCSSAIGESFAEPCHRYRPNRRSTFTKIIWWVHVHNMSCSNYLLREALSQTEHSVSAECLIFA